MDVLQEPKPKKKSIVKEFPLPIILNGEGIYKFKAVYRDFCVVVEEDENVRKLASMGCFGKANLSRSFPTFLQDKVEILRERQYQRRKDWGKITENKFMRKVLVVPDSDIETEIDEYLKEVKPRYEVDRSGITEKLWLGLEESFFLCSAIRCLDIYYEDKVLNEDEVWNLFSKHDALFQENYIAYFYYRSKNWVVKPGIKFGGDFLLYKEGPHAYHASFVVILDILDENLQRKETNFRRSMDYSKILGLNRLCETTGKQLLICQIIVPSDAQIHHNNLHHYLIKEITTKRWLSTQERQAETT